MPRVDFSFMVPGKAVGKSMRTQQHTLKRYPTPKTAAWMDRVTFFATLEARKLDAQFPLKGQVGVEIVSSRAYLKDMSGKKRARAAAGELRPTTKPDVDNIAKSVLDALTGTIYVDDAQVVHLSVYKQWSETSYTMIRVWSLD